MVGRSGSIWRDTLGPGEPLMPRAPFPIYWSKQEAAGRLPVTTQLSRAPKARTHTPSCPSPSEPCWTQSFRSHLLLWVWPLDIHANWSSRSTGNRRSGNVLSTNKTRLLWNPAEWESVGPRMSSTLAKCAQSLENELNKKAFWFYCSPLWHDGFPWTF